MIQLSIVIWIFRRDMDDLQQAEIVKRLTSSKKFIPPWPEPPASHLRKAAVLIPFQRIDHQWSLLFTRRSDLVQDHKGQVSFPGGAQDMDDLDEVDTALREAKEEIGLNPSDVKVLGKLSDIPTMSNFLISPVVAVIPYPYHFIPSTIEVSRIFSIPLTWLADSNHHYEKQRFLQNGLSTRVTYFDDYDGEQLWGITAYLTLCLIELLL